MDVSDDRRLNPLAAPWPPYIEWGVMAPNLRKMNHSAKIKGICYLAFIAICNEGLEKPPRIDWPLHNSSKKTPPVQCLCLEAGAKRIPEKTSANRGGLTAASRVCFLAHFHSGHPLLPPLFVGANSTHPGETSAWA